MSNLKDSFKDCGEDFKNVDEIFREIHCISPLSDATESKKAVETFAEKMKLVLSSLEKDLTEHQAPILREGDVVYARFLLYDLLLGETIDYPLSKISPDIGKVLRRLRRIFQQVFSAFPRILHQLSEGSRAEETFSTSPCSPPRRPNTQASVAASSAQPSASEDMPKVWDIEPVLAPEPERAESPLFVARKDATAPDSDGRHLHQSLSLRVPRSASVSSIRRSLSRKLPSSASPRRIPRQLEPTTPSPQIPPSQGAAAAPNAPQSARTSGQGRGDKPRPSKRDHVPPLSLKQLLDTIHSIYASKRKFDERCAAAGMATETMEQFIYTYLNQRYGLKSLIVEYAGAIIGAVRKYAEQDNDVAVFGKILRHEIDEDFQLVQRQIKETAAQLLRAHLRSKHSLKSEADIEAMLQTRLRGTVTEHEAIDVVGYLHPGEDGKQVQALVRQAMRANPSPPRATSSVTASSRPRSAPETAGRNSATGPKLPFNDFVKVLLDFQLESHESYLRPFIRLFRKCDSDRNGILDEGEFRKLVGLMEPNKTESDLVQLLRTVDPHNNNTITLSQCVALLSPQVLRALAESVPCPPPAAASD